MPTEIFDPGPGPMLVAAHPGDPLERRIAWVEVPSAACRTVVVPSGGDLFATVHRLLDEEGAAGATFALLSGSFAALTLMTGGPGIDTPMTFHGPFEIAVPATVLGGAGVSGIDESGLRTSHSHAAFRDGAGRSVGGHLVAGGAIAGDDGVTIELTSLAGATFVRRFDGETHFTIFHPEPA